MKHNRLFGDNIFLCYVPVTREPASVAQWAESDTVRTDRNGLPEEPGFNPRVGR